MKHWTIDVVWQNVFNNLEDRPIESRKYLYASELGKSFTEVFFKLKGEKFTNPPTIAASQKMEAGKLQEMTIKYILRRAGLLRQYQGVVKVQTELFLPVSGKLDFVAGGHIDLAHAEDFTLLTKVLFEELSMPYVYQRIADSVLRNIDALKEEGANEVDLHTYIYDAKSVSSFVWDMVAGENKVRPYDVLQVFHYLHGKKMDIGKVAYINRDDLRMLELPVYNDVTNYGLYRDWLEAITHYYMSDEQPPLEPLILFSPETGRFSKNTFGVEWNHYLTRLYGFKDPDAYRNKVIPLVTSFNYTFDRQVRGERITDTNKKAIEEAKKYFPNFDNLVDVAKLKRTIQDQETIMLGKLGFGPEDMAPKTKGGYAEGEIFTAGLKPSQSKYPEFVDLPEIAPPGIKTKGNSGGRGKKPIARPTPKAEGKGVKKKKKPGKG